LVGRSFIESKLLLFDDMIALIRMTSLGYEIQAVMKISSECKLFEKDEKNYKKLFYLGIRESNSSTEELNISLASFQVKKEWIVAIQDQVNAIRKFDGLDEIAFSYATPKDVKETSNSSPPAMIPIE
jgi:hypothetical protein